MERAKPLVAMPAFFLGDSTMNASKGPVYIKFPEKTPEQIRKEIEHSWPGTRELNDLEWECRLPPRRK